MFNREFLARVPETALAVRRSVIMPIIAPSGHLVTCIPLLWIDASTQAAVTHLDPTVEWETLTEWLFDLEQGKFYLLCSLSCAERLPATFAVMFPLPDEQSLLEHCIHARMLSVFSTPVPTWVEGLKPDEAVQVSGSLLDTLRQGVGLVLPILPFGSRGLATMLARWRLSHDQLN